MQQKVREKCTSVYLKNAKFTFKMEKIEKNLTPEESLAIIAKSLEQSRKDMLKNGGAPMILWGVLVLVFSLLIFYLWKSTGSAMWNMLWFAMTVIGYLLAWKLGKKTETGVRSFVSEAIGKVWVAFGILAIATPTLTIACLNLVDRFIPDIIFSIYDMQYGIPVTLIIIVLLGLATAITGLILKNGWITAAGIICGTVGTAFGIALHGPYETLLLTGISVIGLIIPGLILNAKTKNE